MIIITKEELEKLKPLTEDKKGSYGTCFLYEDAKVLKTYSNTMPFYYNKRNIKRNIKNSLGVCVKDVAFPIDIAQVKGYKFSYIMPYIDGISFNELLDNIINTEFNMTFDDFIYLYHDAISKANEIASLGIQIDDFHKDNCKIKDDFSIGIFDVDFYERKILFGRFIEKNLRYYNMLEINEAFYNMMKYFYNKKIRFGYCKDNVCELRILYEIIQNFPQNKPNYVDNVLTKINDKLKKETIKDLIIR